MLALNNFLFICHSKHLSSMDTELATMYFVHRFRENGQCQRQDALQCVAI